MLELKLQIDWLKKGYPLQVPVQVKSKHTLPRCELCAATSAAIRDTPTKNRGMTSPAQRLDGLVTNALTYLSPNASMVFWQMWGCEKMPRNIMLAKTHERTLKSHYYRRRSLHTTSHGRC